MDIVLFNEKYLDAIREINASVSSHPNKPLDEKKLSQYLYIDYYTIFSKDNCFVAIENNEVVGYVIAENNFNRFINHLLNSYMEIAKSLNPKFEDYLLNEIRPYKKWNHLYDAHLHMDVKPNYQHQGIGTALIQHELNHLKNNGSIGVMLQVSKTNERANKFYEKNDLIIIDESNNYIRGLRFKD